MDDFKLQEECQLVQDVATYDIPNEHDVRSMDAGEVTALLEGESQCSNDLLYLNPSRSRRD